jgi:hypothetical protein
MVARLAVEGRMDAAEAALDRLRHPFDDRLWLTGS